MTARKPARPAEGGAHELGDRSSLWGPRCRDPAAPVFGLDVLHGEFGRQLLCFDQPMRFAASRARRRRLRLCCHHGRRSRFGVGHRPAERHRAGQASDAGIVQAGGPRRNDGHGRRRPVSPGVDRDRPCGSGRRRDYPKVNQTLADIGTTWLGLAVSAAYAYFGLTPKQTESEARPEARPEAPLEARSEAVPVFLTSAANELSLGQKVPNASELATSGAIARKIKRTDPEFASLVKNLNPKIVFKDEEGTGADRMMTQRLSDRLDRLADLVASEWSDEKLRVTEAWDENNEHAGSSLHYEGRAADLTTSTRDGAKLGRLGRLAVDAGCDWVFFENSAHVHVSMKKV